MDNLVPDFDDLEELSKQIARLKAEIIVLKHQISRTKAEYIREAKTNTNYWFGTKPPTDGYCRDVIALCGNSKEDQERMNNLVDKLSETTESYTYLQGVMRIKKDKLDLYRTYSANNRKGFLNG